MTKSELKTGMIVTLANGKECYVFKELLFNGFLEDVLVEINGADYWHRLSAYYENLTHKDGKEYNIVKVETIAHPYLMVRPNYHYLAKPSRIVIWQRKEKKKYTYAQLREILGEEFEVVG